MADNCLQRDAKGRAKLPETHKRKCWTCGNIADHASDITPGVCCQLCGSQDTRKLRHTPKVKSDGWELLVKFGGKRLYAMVCQAVCDGKMTVDEASRFLGESADDVNFCVAEIECVIAAVRKALDNGLSVDDVMKCCSH